MVEIKKRGKETERDIDLQQLLLQILPRDTQALLLRLPEDALDCQLTSAVGCFPTGDMAHMLGEVCSFVL